MPAIMASVVMTIGRARSRQASISASRWLAPSRSRSIAYSTSRIEFLAAMPISMNRPIIDGIDSSECQSSSATNRAGDAERQGREDGDRFEEAAEQQHHHAVDEPDAGEDGDDEAAEQLVLRLLVGRSSARASRPGGRWLMIGRLLDLAVGVAELGAVGEVGLDDDVVARGRSG